MTALVKPNSRRRSTLISTPALCPDLDRLRHRFTPDRAVIPDVAVDLVPLSAYDETACAQIAPLPMDYTSLQWGVMGPFST